MKEITILGGRRSGKTKALKEMLKGKKYIVVKANDKTYEKTRKAEEKAYKEFAKKTLGINECQERAEKLITELAKMTVKAEKMFARIERKNPINKTFDKLEKGVPLHKILKKKNS